MSPFAELHGYVKEYRIIILAGKFVRKNSRGHGRLRRLSNVDITLRKQHECVNWIYRHKAEFRMGLFYTPSQNCEK